MWQNRPPHLNWYSLWLSNIDDEDDNNDDDDGGDDDDDDNCGHDDNGER